jgi:ketosteroid isomerase-like protein
MDEHPNATLVRDMFAAFQRGDIDAIRRALSEDVVWHFPGREGRLAGSHRGRDAVFAFLLNVNALTSGTFEVDVIDVVANDRHAVAVFRGTGTRNGKTLDNPTCLRMRIDGDQVSELWEFVWDLYHVDDFWT